MACDITQGRAGGKCKDSNGGTRKLYLFNYVENPFTVVNGEVVGISTELETVYQFDLVGNVNPFAEELVTSRDTQTTVNTQTITAVFGKVDATTAAEFSALSKGYPQGVIEDRNGIFHAVGITEGIDFNVASTTGSAQTDLNGFTLTGTAIESSLSPKLDEASITAFKALIV